MAIPRSEFRYLAEQKSPIAYLGVNAIRSSNLTIREAAPTSTDVANFSIGDLWINLGTSPEELYILVTINGDTGQWKLLLPPGSDVGATDFVTDSGTATQSGNMITLVGDGVNTSTSASGQTVTFVLDADITVSGIFTIDAGIGVLQTDNNSELFSSNGTDGQYLYSWGGLISWKNFLTDGSVIITNGDNSVDLRVPQGLDEVFADSGSATPAGDVITIAGGDNINTSASGNTLRINVDDDIVLNSITAAEAFMVLGTDIITANGTVTFQGESPGIIRTSLSGDMESVGTGSNGKLLIAATNAQPEWNSITSLGGTMTVNEGVNSLSFDVVGGGGGGGGGGVGTKPAFLAVVPSTTPTGDFNPWTMGVWLALGESAAMSIIVNQGGHFTAGSGSGLGGVPAQFTAPQDGKFFFVLSLNIDTNSWSAQSYITYDIRLVSNNGSLRYPTTAMTSAMSPNAIALSYRKLVATLDLNAGDKVYAQIKFTTSSSRQRQWIKYLGSGLSNIRCSFGGYLI